MKKENKQNEDFSMRVINYNNVFNTKEMPFWMYSEVIDKFMTMLGNIDEYTEYHCFRVAILTKMFLEHCELDEELNELKLADKKDIVYGAYVHDIGKSQVPSYILKRKGNLSEEEWAELKNHPTNGAFLFLGPGYENIRSIILCHHERYDGKGYPMEYVGKNIPLGARIVALMDSFDAMTDKRPYQTNSPLSLDEAIMELDRFSGKQFDPNLVNVFKYLVTTKEFKKYWEIKNNKEAIKEEAKNLKYWIFNSASLEDRIEAEEKNIAVIKKILNMK